jgi:hypothetical protein
MMHRIAVGFLLLSIALGSAFAANDPPTKTDKASVIVIPGKRADLLLLDENPLATITAYDAIETVFLNGEPIARFAVLPAKSDSRH